MTIFARKTLAATVFVLVLLLPRGETVLDVVECSLICSFSLFTDDREISRIGLSFERRIGFDVPFALLLGLLLSLFIWLVSSGNVPGISFRFLGRLW